MALRDDGLGELLQVSKNHAATQSTDPVFSEVLGLVADKPAGHMRLTAVPHLHD